MNKEAVKGEALEGVYKQFHAPIRDAVSTFSFSHHVPVWQIPKSSERFLNELFLYFLREYSGERGWSIFSVGEEKEGKFFWADADNFEQLEELGERTLRHTVALEHIEADVAFLKSRERGRRTREAVPAYVDEELERLSGTTGGLSDAAGDAARVLYYVTEVEAILGRLEEKARAAKKKYEGRLAACLRDVCWVNEPHELSEEQIERFCACLKALVSGWGKLNREKLKWICERLLEVELTWLPVTAKILKGVGEDAKSGQ